MTGDVEPVATSAMQGRVPRLPGTGAGFGAFMARMRQAGQLVVQPRMGMSDPATMRSGLLATKRAAPTTVGTITVDSFTRVGDHDAVRRALRDGSPLNGYPMVVHPVETTRAVLEGVRDASFPVQVRHGAADPRDIFAALLRSGLDATEGGPVSYCLPYSRRPLSESVEAWTQACRLLGELRAAGAEPHLETFGGCMMGQLCPPGLLVALSVLEAVFFRRHGLRSISLSYAQQTCPQQDTEAIHALRTLAAELLPDVDWHVVIYAYMGVYPRTPHGASRLLEEAARLAVSSGAARLIVKTTAEAHRIPTVAENITALRTAAAAAAGQSPAGPAAPVPDTGILAEARAIVDAVLDLDTDLGRALVTAFRSGLLDVPYCLHPDNAGKARSYLDGDGRLRWASLGGLPIGHLVKPTATDRMTSSGLLESLSYVARSFDATAPDRLTTKKIPGCPGTANAATHGTELECVQ